MQRSIRFPAELDAKIQARADADDRSFSYVVIRALESALGSRSEGGVPAGVQSPPASASTRAPRHAPSAPGDLPRSALPADHRALALERQAKLNKAKS